MRRPGLMAAAAGVWILGCAVFLTATAPKAAGGLLCTNLRCNTAFSCTYAPGFSCTLYPDQGYCTYESCD